MKAARRASGLLKLGIPVKIVAPRFMQVVRRETAAIFLELPDVGRDRHRKRRHPALFRQLVGLAKIAGAAGGDDMVPRWPRPRGDSTVSEEKNYNFIS